MSELVPRGARTPALRAHSREVRRLQQEADFARHVVREKAAIAGEVIVATSEVGMLARAVAQQFPEVAGLVGHALMRATHSMSQEIDRVGGVR